MSTRRPGTCAEPGPYATHCTQDVGHRYSCYDAGDDSSWNDRFPEDWQTDTPHGCGDPECPDNPVPVMCTNSADCTADEHMVCCPSTEREPISDRAAEAILGLVDTDRQLRSDRQTWERRIVGTDVAEQRMHLEVDGDGRVRVHEAVLAQLLADAGWERTA